MNHEVPKAREGAYQSTKLGKEAPELVMDQREFDEWMKTRGRSPVDWDKGLSFL
jgi:hypothetical protein